MAETDRPDLLVIGAGRAGFAAAAEGVRLGAEVVVIERGRPATIGAAVTARALAAAASRAQLIRSASAFGIAGEEPRINHRRLHDRVAEIVAGIAPDHGLERLAALGAECVEGEAVFVDPSTVRVDARTIKARRIVVATGSRSVVPDLQGLADIPFFTAETIVHNTRKLSHLLVIGGGATALELAQTHRRLGSEVTLVTPGGFLERVDPELAEIALRQVREEGVTLLDSTGVKAIRPRSQGIGVVIRGSDGSEHPLDVSHVLVAGDRSADLVALDPARGGIALDASGQPLLTQGIISRNRRVYVIGTAAGDGVPVHAAEAQGRAAARHALLGEALRPAVLAGARLVHIDPPVAEIGLDAAEASARTGARVLRLALSETDFARLEGAPYGLVKLTVDGAGRILSGGIVGMGAAEAIGLLALAVEAGLTLSQFADFVPAYPSLADGLRRLAAESRQGISASAGERRRFAVMKRLPWR